MLGFPLFQLLFFAYVGRAASFQDDTFYVVGNAIMNANAGAIFGTSFTIGGERWTHTLSSVLATPANRFALFVGRALPNIANGIVVSVFCFVVGYLLLDVTIDREQIPALAVVVIVSTVSCACFGLVIGSIGLRARDAVLYANLAYFAMLVFCGVNVPLDDLPELDAGDRPLRSRSRTGSRRAGRSQTARRCHDVRGLLTTELLIGLVYAAFAYGAASGSSKREGRRRASFETVVSSLGGVQTERHLTWDGCANVRDLGGHQTPYGETRWGAIVRADAIRRLTDAGWEELVGHGVSTIVDLRMDEELEADPPAELPVEVVHVNVLAGSPSDYGEQLDALVDAVDDARREDEGRLRRLPRALRPELGRCDPRDRRRAAGRRASSTARAARTARGSSSRCCSRSPASRDEEIAADYALSERNLVVRQAQWESEASDDAERERRRQIGRTPPEAMVGVLDELDARYGGVREFLLAQGATDDELDRAVARLLG